MDSELLFVEWLNGDSYKYARVSVNAMFRRFPLARPLNSGAAGCCFAVVYSESTE